MVWQQWLLLAFVFINSVLIIPVVGLPRGPLTRPQAVIAVVLNACVSLLVVSI